MFRKRKRVRKQEKQPIPFKARRQRLLVNEFKHINDEIKHCKDVKNILKKSNVKEMQYASQAATLEDILFNEYDSSTTSK
jgi:hypothetical protein